MAEERQSAVEVPLAAVDFTRRSRTAAAAAAVHASVVLAVIPVVGLLRGPQHGEHASRSDRDGEDEEERWHEHPVSHCSEQLYTHSGARVNDAPPLHRAEQC